MLYAIWRDAITIKTGAAYIWNVKATEFKSVVNLA